MPHTTQFHFLHNNLHSKYDIFAAAVCHVLVEQHIQTVCVFQRTAQGLQISASLVAHRLAFGRLYALFVFLKIFRLGVN